MMSREPVTIPPQPGVYALVNRERKFAYVAHTVNLQKRSHSMSHMLVQADRKPKATYWAIAGLPRHPSDEFTFMVLAAPVDKHDGAAAVLTAQRSLRAKGFKIIDGNRASTMVVYKNKPMTLAEALRSANSTVKYLTAWRRVERGWSIEQALGLAAPDPRWDHTKSKERRRRALSLAA
jgi:hypothetical protein